MEKYHHTVNAATRILLMFSVHFPQADVKH